MGQRSRTIRRDSFNTPAKQRHRELWGSGFIAKHGRRYSRNDWRVLCLPSVRREEVEIYRSLNIPPKQIVGVENATQIFREMQRIHRDIRLYPGHLRDFVADWSRGEGAGAKNPWFQIANADFSSTLYHNVRDLARLVLVLDPRACLGVCATTAHDFQTPLMGVLFSSLFGELVGREKILAFKSSFFTEAIRNGLMTLDARGRVSTEQRAVVENSFLRELSFLWIVAIGLLCHPFRDYRQPPQFTEAVERLDRLLELTRTMVAFTQERGSAELLNVARPSEALDVIHDAVEDLISRQEWHRLIGAPRMYLAPYAVRRIKYYSRRTLVESWFLKFVNGSATQSWSFAEVLRMLIDQFQHAQVEFIELDAKRRYVL